MIPPTMAPTMPSRVVMPIPIGLRPGTTRRASAPTMSPTMTIVTMSVSTGTSGQDATLRRPEGCARSDGPEADATAFALRDLDVGELVGRDDDAAPLLVRQREGRGSRLERGLDRLLDLLGRLRRVDRQLARGALDADPDLHP